MDYAKALEEMTAYNVALDNSDAYNTGFYHGALTVFILFAAGMVFLSMWRPD